MPMNRNIEEIDALIQQAEVRPCPFCGCGKVFVEEGSTYRWVLLTCADCDASCGEVRHVLGTPFAETAASLLKEWNTRAATP